jgi:hypothetical protein
MIDVPRGLRVWFLIHFIVDLLFAIPLIFFPDFVLPLFDIHAYDLLTPRLVGAALIGIGGTSFVVRNEGGLVFNALLNLKILWSFSAILSIAFYVMEGGSKMAWIPLAFFFVFAVVWNYYKFILNK